LDEIVQNIENVDEINKL